MKNKSSLPLSFDQKIVITNLELSVPLKSAPKSGKNVQFGRRINTVFASKAKINVF